MASPIDFALSKLTELSVSGLRIASAVERIADAQERVAQAAEDNTRLLATNQNELGQVAQLFEGLNAAREPSE